MPVHFGKTGKNMNDVSAKKVLQARAYITVWGVPYLMDKPTDAVQYADRIEIEVGNTRLEIDDLDEAVSTAARLLIEHGAEISKDTHKDLGDRIESARDERLEKIQALDQADDFEAAPAPAGP
jgi:hypothetical protein